MTTATDTTAQQLDELCHQWLQAKGAETKAAETRKEIEEKIILITGHREEGSATVKHGAFSIETKGTLLRSMDWEAWKTAQASIPQELHPVKYKPELNLTGVKWLQENRPDIYAQLPLTVKPGKTGVKVTQVTA